jgi:hypothetical protein
MNATDNRRAAELHVHTIMDLLSSAPNRHELQPLIDECESLVRAITAFHLEAIRFRMFNVDRLLTRGGLPVPDGVAASFAAARQELEAAGFHTRSH